MGIMGYLRDRMGTILAVVIGFALLAFVAGEVIKSGSSMFKDSASEIGVINGTSISYSEFNKKLEASTEQFKQQSGQGISPQITNYLQETTWNQFLTDGLLGKEMDKLGIAVGEAETQSMISGPTPAPQIAQQFTDQQTGQFDRARLNQFLQYLQTPKADTGQIKAWGNFVGELIKDKKRQKYLALVTTGLYVNQLDAQDDYTAKNKLANFKYTVLDYASIPDNKVTITDEDYNAYYNEHKAEYKNKQELRSFDYVTFNAAPSKEDSLAIKAQIEKLAADLKVSTNDSLFVQINSVTKAPIVFRKKGQLEPQLDSVMFSAAPGFVYGPFLSNGSYKIAKLVTSKIGPDSVKARHILINPATEGGVDKALAKADSIKKLLASGKSFADLANTYSIDKNANAKGGDLGTFARGMMIPAFDDVVFDAKKGDIKIFTTQYGVHLVEIENVIGSSKVVKVAIVDKQLEATQKTQNEAYNKAQAFLGTLTKNNFEAQAKKAGLTLKKADDVTGIAGTLPGLDNARALVRWAFKADKGDFSEEVYPIGDQYVIASLTEVKPIGYLSLDAVKKQIEPAVRIIVKGKQLADKLQAASNGGSIDQVAQKVGGKVVPVQNIVLANPVIPGSGPEYKLIGSIFGAKPNKLSTPVVGTQGVYVYTLDSFVNPATLTNAVREKQTLGAALAQRADGAVLEALKDKANVKDNRAKFL